MRRYDGPSESCWPNNDQVTPAELPRLIVKRSTIRLVLMIIIGLLFISIGVVVLQMPSLRARIIALIGLIFLGGVIPAVIIQLLTGKGNLILDHEGFSYSTYYQKYRYSWNNVTPFEVVDIYRGRASVRVIKFSLLRGRNSMNKLNLALMGVNHGLPNNFMMSLDQLTRLMNAYRLEATQIVQSKTPPSRLDNVEQPTFGRRQEI